MRFITGLLFLINAAAWIFLDVVCWSLAGVGLGLPLLIGIIGFFIAWAISGDAVVAPLEYIAYPEWEIFTKKLKWANLTVVNVFTAFVVLCLIFDWLSMRELFDINI